MFQAGTACAKAGLQSFLMAVVTDFHKLNDSKQHRLILLQPWR